MRGTRAYIASAGTAAVMLGASLALLALVSAFVAFGSWPGAGSGRSVQQVFLNEVAKTTPKKVAVGSAAVRSARRADARRQVAQARIRTRPGAPARTGGGRVPAGTPVARAPASTVGGTGTPSATTSPAAPIQQQAQSVTRNLDTATQQVQNTVTNVQTQVNQVVDQVIGAPQNDVTNTVTGTVNQVTGTVGGTVNQVTTTAGSLLGH